MIRGGHRQRNQSIQCWTFLSVVSSPKDRQRSLESNYIPESFSLAHKHTKHAPFRINVMLMCLWVMREISQRGPDILGNERECEHEEFKAFKIKLILVWFSRSFYQAANWASHIQDRQTEAAKSFQSVRLEVNMRCFFFFFFWVGAVYHFNPWKGGGLHVWQIRPTILENVCGYSWPTSHDLIEQPSRFICSSQHGDAHRAITSSLLNHWHPPTPSTSLCSTQPLYLHLGTITRCIIWLSGVKLHTIVYYTSSESPVRTWNKHALEFHEWLELINVVKIP